MSRLVNQLALPPRPVPSLLRWHVLLGSLFTLLGWGVFAFGMIFFWVFDLPSNVGSLLLRRTPMQSTEGVVTDIRETNASENDVRVHAYHFTFSAADGQTHPGVSYFTGNDGSLKPGQKVNIEYPEGDPSKAYIEGMRRSTFGTAILFVAIFPAVRLGLVVAGIREGINANRLLADGKPVIGRLTAKTVTDTAPDGTTTYRLTFELTAEDGRDYHVRTHNSDPERLVDGLEEPLLYDPKKPSYAVPAANLPGGAEVDSSGHLKSSLTPMGLLSLALPVAVLGANGTYFYLAYMR